MVPPVDLSGRTFCLISGASRGIGRQFAVEIAEKVGKDSTLVLLARDLSKLESTKEEIHKQRPDVKVCVHSMDLSKGSAGAFKDVIEPHCQSVAEKSFDVALIVHNVGTVGDIGQWMHDASDMDKWTSYYHLNVFAVALLNNLFLSHFKQAAATTLVVNITSLCAIEAMKSMGYYCSAKAAREMFFRVLALENPDVIVLNYSPGMVETDMAAELRRNAADEQLRTYACEQFEKGAVLTPHQTTQKFLSVIRAGTFKSGDHVDYHD